MGENKIEDLPDILEQNLPSHPGLPSPDELEEQAKIKQGDEDREAARLMVLGENRAALEDKIKLGLSYNRDFLKDLLVKLWSGNVHDTCERFEAAGVPVPQNVIYRLLKDDKVRQRILEQFLKNKPAAVAKPNEIRAYWTHIMRYSQAPGYRMAASELLAKSVGMMVEQVQVQHYDMASLLDDDLKAAHAKRVGKAETVEVEAETVKEGAGHAP